MVARLGRRRTGKNAILTLIRTWAGPGRVSACDQGSAAPRLAGIETEDPARRHKLFLENSFCGKMAKLLRGMFCGSGEITLQTRWQRLCAPGRNMKRLRRNCSWSTLSRTTQMKVATGERALFYSAGRVAEHWLPSSRLPFTDSEKNRRRIKGNVFHKLVHTSMPQQSSAEVAVCRSCKSTKLPTGQRLSKVTRTTCLTPHY
jgi:hypothetical protein